MLAPRDERHRMAGVRQSTAEVAADAEPERPAKEELKAEVESLKVVDADNALLAVLRYKTEQDKFNYACVFQKQTLQEHHQR